MGDDKVFLLNLFFPFDSALRETVVWHEFRYGGGPPHVQLEALLHGPLPSGVHEHEGVVLEKEEKYTIKFAA